MNVKSSLSLRKHNEVGIFVDIWPHFGEGGKSPKGSDSGWFRVFAVCYEFICQNSFVPGLIFV